VRRHKAGWILILLCGVFGAANGLISYGSSLLSIFDHTRPWSTGAGSTSITLEQIGRWSSEAASYWLLVNLVAWANLTFTTLTLAAAAWFGIRRHQGWGWRVALLFWLWVGLNDSLGVVLVYRMTGNFIPTAPIPLTAGLVGLILTYPASREAAA
jgi:hypothetical protein